MALRRPLNVFLCVFMLFCFTKSSAGQGELVMVNLVSDCYMYILIDQPIVVLYLVSSRKNPVVGGGGANSAKKI